MRSGHAARFDDRLRVFHVRRSVRECVKRVCGLRRCVLLFVFALRLLFFGPGWSLPRKPLRQELALCEILGVPGEALAVYWW